MPTFTYQAVDATPTGDDGATAGTLRVVPMRLQKGAFVRTGKEFQVPLTAGSAEVALEVTAPGEAYKIVESFTGGNGSGYWVVVKDGDTEWADLEIVSQPGTSLPTAIWEANLVSLRARVDQVEGVAEAASGAVEDLADVATSGSYTDLTNKPSIPSTAGLASTAYVDSAVAPKASTAYVDSAVAAVPGATDAGVSAVIGSPLTKAALDAAYPSKQTPYRALNVLNGGSVVAARCGNPGSSYGFSNGTDTSMTTVVKHKLLDDPGDFWVYYNNAGAGGAGLNDITIKCALEMPDGTIYPVRSKNGAATAVLGVSGIVAFGPLPAPPGVGKGAIVRSRTTVSVTAGQKWPYNGSTTNSSEGIILNADYAYAGVIPNALQPAFFPMCLVSAKVSPLVGVCADSIGAGQADSGVPSGTDGGYIQRALAAANIGYLSSCKPGELASQFVAPAVFIARFAPLSACTDIVFEHGINDVNSGNSLATIKANQIALWYAAKVRGIRAWQTTTTPASTAANTVPAVNDLVRTQDNDWLRDGAPMLNGVGVATGSNAVGTIRIGAAAHPASGYFEIADLAETARNSGLWKPGYSTDGTHPNGTGHPALSAGIITSRFTA